MARRYVCPLLCSFSTLTGSLLFECRVSANNDAFPVEFGRELKGARPHRFLFATNEIVWAQIDGICLDGYMDAAETRVIRPGNRKLWRTRGIHEHSGRPVETAIAC